jgi:single-stranded DNA-binding protein
METNFLENNSLVLMGKVANEKTFSHEIYGEKFYQFSLSVPRLSGNADNIPITISERLFRDEDIAIGKNVKVNGQFRSYNGYENNKNRLVLTVFVKDIEFLPDGEEVLTDKDVVSNEVDLTGFICKPPIYRQTPFGREITDILIAVNRAYNKSDYIPCIAWGRNARFCSKMPVGTEVKVTGRVQSRNYEKKYEDGTVEQRVAYEVSVSNLEVVNGEATEEAPVEETAE